MGNARERLSRQRRGLGDPGREIGSIAGPFAASLILSTRMPVHYIFAVLAICPAVFVVCIFIVGRIHSSTPRREAQMPAPQMAGAG